MELVTTIGQILSGVVGLVFAYACWTKLSAMRQFIEAVGNYRLVPGYLVPATAVLLLLSELGIAITHVGLFGLRFGAPFGTLLLFALLLIVAVLLRRGTTEKCFCFGASDNEILGTRTLVRIALLLAAEVSLAVCVRASGGSLGPWTIEALVVSAAIVTLASWILTIPDIHLWIRLRPKQSASH